MRNRPAKLDPKLTVLLYVLTRHGGLDRIALCLPRHTSRRRAALVMRWNTRRGYGKRGTADICGNYSELQQKAAASNYFRPQATTVDNLITVAIPAATWLFSTRMYVRVCTRTTTRGLRAREGECTALSRP